MKHYNFHFDRKSIERNGAVIIEGFSNKNVPDRVNERMDPKGARLDNYRKNPIILFNHGKDAAFGIMPVGKGLVVEATDDGIYTKAHISNSKTEKISVIRDLVEEDILKTFSLGYDTFNESKDSSGVTILTDWELLEQSLVPIPMNQDSIGSLVKRYKNKGNRFGCKYLEIQVLATKGAFIAAALQKRIYDLKLNDVNKVLAMVSDMTGAKLLDIKEVLAGDRPATKDMIRAFSKHLNLAENELLGLKNLEGKMDMGNEPKETPAAEQLKEEPKKNGGLVLQKISVPKKMYDEAENARGFVESHGYKADEMDEDDESYHFTQAPVEGLDSSKAVDIDLGDGVTGKAMPKMVDDQKPVEDQEQKAAATPQDLLNEALNSGDNGERAMLLVRQALEMLGTPTEGVSSKMCDDEDQKQEKMAPMASGSEAAPPNEDPHLLTSRQTNVLLGTLIMEIQKLSQKLDGLGPQKPAEVAPPPSQSEAKNLETLRNFQHNIDMRLKRLNA